MYSTRHFKLDTIFLIQFYSAAIIQFGSVFHSDSTPTAKIRLNIPDPTQMIWLKLTHNFRFIFTQISDIILLPLNAYDSSFLIQLRYCSSIWLIISNFFTQYFWINFTLFYKFDLTLTAWIWLTISDLKHYLQFNYNQFSIRFKYHCTNFIFNLTVIADFSALWESSPTSHSKKKKLSSSSSQRWEDQYIAACRGRGDVDTSITHVFYQKVDFWFVGGDFVLHQSILY